MKHTEKQILQYFKKTGLQVIPLKTLESLFAIDFGVNFDIAIVNLDEAGYIKTEQDEKEKWNVRIIIPNRKLNQILK